MSAHESQRRRSYCNKCSDETWHDVLWIKTNERTSEEDAFWAKQHHLVLQCRGCDQISFKVIEWDSEDLEPDGTPSARVESYPPKTFRRPPHWQGELLLDAFLDDSHFLNLLDEIYVALQNDCARLAVMGIRALLEAIMVDKCQDQGSFAKNLDAFQNQGYISPIQGRTIEPVIEAGHAVIHRSFKPKHEQALTALDITESIIESIYVASKEAKNLKVPSRANKE
jgi:hypothetical protein